MYDHRKCLVIDVDDTICWAADPNKPYDYKNANPILKAIDHIRQYHYQGWYIIFHTARYFREFNGDIVKIYQKGYNELKDWLDKYDVPYDLIVLGKPSATFYLDDKAFRIDYAQDWDKLDNYLITKERHDAVV